jgi:hypothetical protein
VTAGLTTCFEHWIPPQHQIEWAGPHVGFIALSRRTGTGGGWGYLYAALREGPSSPHVYVQLGALAAAFLRQPGPGFTHDLGTLESTCFYCAAHAVCGGDREPASDPALARRALARLARPRSRRPIRSTAICHLGARILSGRSWEAPDPRY